MLASSLRRILISLWCSAAPGVLRTSAAAAYCFLKHCSSPGITRVYEPDFRPVTVDERFELSPDGDPHTTWKNAVDSVIRRSGGGRYGTYDLLRQDKDLVSFGTKGADPVSIAAYFSSTRIRESPILQRVAASLSSTLFLWS